MRKRKSPPKELINELLLKSRRRCPMCFNRLADATPKAGSVAHIRSISEGGDNSLDNLVFLCFEHHAELDKTPRGSGLEMDIKKARQTLYQAIEEEGNVPTTGGPSVFLIYGRDVAAKEQVLRFLTECNLAPIMIEEQPNFGTTAYEKLEGAVDVIYAIAILSPEELTGAQRDQTPLRARQNVIFELGFFLGRLGRQRVCALFKPGIEIPSDLHGVLYIEMDQGGIWRRTLSRELMAVGISIKPQPVQRENA